MSMSSIKLPNLTILNGGSNSNVLTADGHYGDGVAVSLLAPAALDAGTYTLEVTDDPKAASPVFRTLQIGDPVADANAPAAGKARTYWELPTYAGFRIHYAGAGITADRTWAASKQLDVS